MADLKRWEVKALCMFGLFGSMLIFVLLPIRVAKAVDRQGKRGRYILSLLTCFGGGVFFGAYLIHMNPEVRAILVESLLDPYGIWYPLPELFAGGGFFLILFIEKFVLWLRARSEKKQDNKNATEDIDNALGKGMTNEGLTGSAYEVSIKLTGASFLKTDGLHDTPIGRFVTEEEAQTKKDSLEVDTDPEKQAIPNGRADAISVSSKKSLKSSSEVEGAAQARSVIFVIALSLDCVFEGLALGLKDNTTSVISLFIAIISHEFIMSFCIGLELVKYNGIKKVVGVGIMYAFTPVFGAIIGTAIVESRDTLDNTQTIDMVSGILQAISAGTFIYCAFIGILSEQLTHDNGFYKALVVLLGFALMAAMAAIPDTAESTEVHLNTTALPLSTV